MRFSAIACLLGLLAATAAPALAAQSQPPSDLMANVQTFLAITQAKSSVQIDSLFTPDAVIVDESAPYRWNGAHAASAWLAHINGRLAAKHMGNFRVEAGNFVEFSQTTELAYLILPLSISATATSRPFHETGTMTFTFERTSGDWKIATAVWATATRSP